jgi:3-hydroxybutyryl-CoA dehydrogenase
MDGPGQAAKLPEGPLAVLGAGTMGTGIAQAAAVGAIKVLLYDAQEGAAQRAVSRVNDQLQRLVEKGRMQASAAEAAVRRIEPVETIEDLAPCFMAIEAAPESLELKQRLFEEVAAACGDSIVLATNTSSLPVTAIASTVPHAERVVGMHFFNPVPLMQLVEVVAGLGTGLRAVTVAHAVAARMGKQAIDAADVAGFLVNRVSRPFLLEAQRLLLEKVATHETIDRIVRLGGGFRMGPFELSDLVGVDVGFDIARSFYELSFHEPRWQPSPIPQRLVAAGRLGRKSGQGYYDYSGEGPYREPDPPAVMPDSASGAAQVLGEGPLADELRRLAKATGYEVPDRESHPDASHAIVIDTRLEDTGRGLFAYKGAKLVLCASGSLATIGQGKDVAGFMALPPLGETHIVELTTGHGTSDETARAAAHFFHSLGKHVEWVGDTPGLVLGRIVCQLVNEAAFAVEQQIGSVDDIDRGVRLGLNYPRGLLEWGDAIGLRLVLGVLDGLQRETGSDRYRAAPLLRRMVGEGLNGRAVGRGFHTYETGESAPGGEE